MLAQQAVPDKANELAAIPPLLERLGAENGSKGALVSIATNAAIARAIIEQDADYLLAVKANQPTLRAEIEAGFAAAQDVETHVAHDKGHGRIEERRMSVLRETGWLQGDRHFPGELRLPGTACLLRAATAPRRAASSPPVPSTPRRTPPRRCASTGPSRTAFIGCSKSPSATTSPGSTAATAHATWPPSATSP